MLLAARGAPRDAGAMPGMGASGSSLGSFPALAVVLAMFMIGYIMRTTDRLAALARARTIPAGEGGPVLAPKLAACGKLAMGITMGYMLVAMI